ncbi:hypothetical protein J2Z19_006089 [Ensifer adhaerens]|uniref:Uncharacterized protein n=3 Tax=Ensifer adhaerens TaxID=106592 RepID=A0ACC5T5W2_ENSAD|nr:hypothetical protein [Ensifer adhaerens]
MKSSPLKQLLLPLRNDGRRGSSTWLQFCPRCLADDAQPYFRQRWRFATQVSCLIHGCGLRDRCPCCASRIAPFDQVELVPQHFCAGCGFDLRRAPNIVVRAPARRLDRCINDICRMEAITGSLTRGNPGQRRAGQALIYIRGGQNWALTRRHSIFDWISAHGRM